MLKQRILSSLILAPLFIAIVLLAPTALMEGVLSLVVVLAAYEWTKLAGLNYKVARFIYPLSLLCIIYLGKFFASTIDLYTWIYWIAAVWWMLVMLLLFSVQYLKASLVLSFPLKLIMGALTLLPMWYAISDLFINYKIGAELTLFIFMVIWSADIGAYFAGRSLGRTKLASLISPSKTLEGVAGGLLAVLIFASICAYFLGLQDEKLIYFIVISLISAVGSIGGDLFESLLKRQAGVKDSGKIIPGHGGLLDRIDSMTAAVPIFVFGYGCLVV